MVQTKILSLLVDAKSRRSDSISFSSVPETPSAIEIKDAEMGMVNVTWDEPEKPNGVITGYVVQYKNVVGSKLLGKETEGTRRWVIIDNLAPAAIYDFYVAAKTSPGTGRFKKKRFDFSWRK